MRKIRLFGTMFLICIGYMTVHAQSNITVDASQIISTFNFVDSDGDQQKDDYRAIITNAYGFGYRYDFDFGLSLNGGLGMRTGGASLVYDDMNYSWRLQYGQIKIGAGYTYDLGRFSPYFNLSGYYGYLFRGFQTLNNEDFNITESEILNRNDIGLMFSPGCMAKISDYISVYGEYSYLLGLANIEMDEGQESQNRGHVFTLGLSFTITDLNN